MAPWLVMALLSASFCLVIFDGDDEDLSDAPDTPEDPDTPGPVTDGTGGDDMLQAIANETLNGLDGNDTLSSTPESDGAVLNGGIGADAIDLQGLNGTVNAGEGADTITMEGPIDPDTATTAVANGDAGDDTITANGLGGTVNGGGGEDYISVQGTLDGVFGDNGNDTLVSDTADYGGGTPLSGGDGNDQLITTIGAGFNTQTLADGGAGDDLLAMQMVVGSDGVDVFDILTGGSGADDFQMTFFNAGDAPEGETQLGQVTEITDFDPAEDRLLIDPGYLDPDGPEDGYETSFELSEADDGSYTDVIFTVASTAADTSMTGTIRLAGVTGLTADAVNLVLASAPQSGIGGFPLSTP